MYQNARCSLLRRASPLNCGWLVAAPLPAVVGSNTVTPSVWSVVPLVRIPRTLPPAPPPPFPPLPPVPPALPSPPSRSDEHTSELQSRGHLVCCLLLVK